MKSLVITAILSVAAGTLSAGSPAGYVRVLVPLSRAVTPGAHGSTWLSFVSIYNAADRAITLGSDVIGAMILCTPEIPPPRSPEFLPMEGSSICPAQTATPGSVLFLREDVADRILLSSRIEGSASGPRRTWTTVPVAREADFQPAIELFEVWPSDQFRRTMLRIYDPSATPGAAVRIRITSAAGEPRVFADFPVVLTTAATNGEFSLTPAYHETFISGDSFPGLPREQLRVHLDSLDGRTIWGFVTMTDNASSEVDLVLPQ